MCKTCGKVCDQAAKPCAKPVAKYAVKRQNHVQDLWQRMRLNDKTMSCERPVARYRVKKIEKKNKYRGVLMM